MRLQIAKPIEHVKESEHGVMTCSMPRLSSELLYARGTALDKLSRTSGSGKVRDFTSSAPAILVKLHSPYCKKSTGMVVGCYCALLCL